MRKQPLNLTADPAIRATFQAQLAEARETPGLSRLVTQPAPDLYPRYSDYYRQLSQLPRRVRRGLQRQWKRSLSALALLLALGQAPALAATINVDGTNCTLADAIHSANTNAAVGGCTAGSGADRLVLAPKSTHTLTTVEDTTYGDTGLPLVTSTITIAGHKSTIERGAGAPEFRLVAVSRTGKLTLEKLTVSGRLLRFSGGGVSNNGTLILRIALSLGIPRRRRRCISTPVAASPSRTAPSRAIPPTTAAVCSTFGTLTLTNSTVSGNTAIVSGGGVGNHDATLTLANSTVSGNTAATAAGGGGGGVDSNGTLTLTNSTVSGNTAFSSGGGVVSGGTLTLTNSTVSGNKVRRRRRSKWRCASTIGTLTVTNSTVSGNTAAGGSLPAAEACSSTSMRPHPHEQYRLGQYGRLRRRRCVHQFRRHPHPGPESRLRQHLYERLGGVQPAYDSGTVNADDFNLFGHNGDAGVVGFSPGLTDLVPSEGLGAILNTTLANNGGPTRTHALVAGSPAIDAVGASLPTTRHRSARHAPTPRSGLRHWRFRGR